MKTRFFTTGLRALAIASVAVMALSGCTNAESSGSGTPEGSTAFDPSTIVKDAELAALVPASIRDKGKLTIGSDTTYAPAEFLGGSDGQTPMGFDVDFAKAIGGLLDLKIDYQSSPFTSIIPALGTKFDAGFSAFTVTNERMKSVNMVGYTQSGTIWAVQKGNPKNFSLDNICGKKIGVQTGSIQEDPDIKNRNQKCLDEGKPAIDVISLPKQTDITTRLIAGGIEAMASGASSVGYAVTQTQGQIELLGKLYNADVMGIAVAKDDTELADLISKSFDKLIESGDYHKILATWGMEVLAVDKSVVNPEVKK